MSDHSIKTIFKKDISRNINPVVLVQQDDKDIVRQELEEYVVVNEIEGIFRDFFNAYEKKTTEDIGVWISGFFGSGKSHFLKILSYILQNEDFEGKRAFEYVKDKFSDSLLISRIESTIRSIQTQTILFDIGTLANVDSRHDKNGIAEIVQKALDQSEGYFAETPWLAEFERKLNRQGKYQKFQEAYKSITQKEWVEDREKHAFLKPKIVEALQQSNDLSIEDARYAFDSSNKDYSLSVKTVVKNIKDYLDSRNSDVRLAFMIDEVGQYIGESKQLMLNLQNVAEELREQLQGRAWLMVTSQEAIDQLTKQFPGKDFSRIQDRFSTKLSLAGNSADIIVKKRLLEKTDGAHTYFEQLYQPNESRILNQLNLHQATNEYRPYLNCNDFINTYPFTSYQFHLIQELFKQLRFSGISGKDSADTERTMIKVVHKVADTIKEEKIGTLATIQQFYDSFYQELRHDVRQTIERAHETRDLETFDVSVLKTLFMIKYVPDIKGTLENITTLMVTDLDQDKVTLTDKVKESLQKLETENLIQRSVDQYEYLTNTEQEVISRIKNIEIKPYEKVNQIRKIIQEQIYPEKKYSQNKNNYGFNIIVDDADSNLREEISLRVITFYHDDYREDPSHAAFRYATDSEVVIVLPNQQDLNDSLERQLQIEKYLTQETTTSVSQEIKTVHDNKREELSKLKAKNIELIESAIVDSSIFLNSQPVSISSKTAKEIVHQALGALVETAYPKSAYLKIPARDINEIISLLRAQQTTIDSGNQQAAEELTEYIENNAKRNNPINIHDVKTRFTRKPYGWDETGTLGLLAELVTANTIDLELSHIRLDPSDPKDVAQKITNNKNASSIVIKLKKQIQSDIISQVQNIIREIFDNPADLPDNQDDLKQKALELVRHELDKIEQLDEGYREYAYPGNEPLATYRQQLKGVLEHQEIEALFDYLISNQEDIRTAKSNAKSPINFFDNQKPIFNSAVDLLYTLEDDKPFLPETIHENLGKMKDILASSDPYDLIKDLTLLESDVKSTHQELLESEKESLTQKVDQLISDLTELAHSQNITGIDDQIKDRLDGFKAHINSRSNISAVKAAPQQISQIETEIVALINSTQGENGSSPTKPVQMVSVRSLVERSSINNPEELDDYIGQLKQKLLDILNQGNQIKLS